MEEFKLALLSYSDHGGGAHNATGAFFDAVNRHGSNFGLHIHLFVVRSRRGLENISVGYPNLSIRNTLSRRIQITFRQAKKMLFRLLGGTGLSSRAGIDTGLSERIQDYSPDLLIVNWLGDYTVSLRELGSMKVPLLIRNADEWFFSGSWHFSHEPVTDGFLSIVQSKVREALFGREDHLLRLWKIDNMASICSGVISPSDEMNRKSSASYLGNLPHYVLPNPIDTEFWRPQSWQSSREKYGFAEGDLAIGVGAFHLSQDSRKGWDLLGAALTVLADTDPGLARLLRVDFFGGATPRSLRGLPIRLHNHGELSPLSLRDFYSAVDVVVVPSRKEGFSNLTAEAQACGTPVVAFDVGGLREIITHEQTGYLAKAYDVNDLVDGITLLLKSPRLSKMGDEARVRMEKNFSQISFVERLDMIARATAGEAT